MKSDIFTVFQNVNGASFVSIDTVTTPILQGGKSNPLQKRVKKVTTGSVVMVFQNKNSNGYENMVKRRLEAEGKNPNDFQLSDRKWGTRIPNMPVVEHEKDGITKHYLEVIFLKPGTTKYFLDNVEISKEDIHGLNDSEAAQGGLSDDNKVIIRTFAVDSLTEVRIDGKAFV